MSNNPPKSDNSEPSASEALTRNILSQQNATARIVQCEKYLSFATYLLDQLRQAQRRLRLAAGRPLSAEDREEAAALEQLWKQLCDGKLVEQPGQVLEDSFVDEAEAEMERLDWIDKSAAAVQAREAWREVARLVRRCRQARMEGESLVASLSAVGQCSL